MKGASKQRSAESDSVRSTTGSQNSGFRTACGPFDVPSAQLGPESTTRYDGSSRSASSHDGSGEGLEMKLDHDALYGPRPGTMKEKGVVSNEAEVPMSATSYGTESFPVDTQAGAEKWNWGVLQFFKGKREQLAKSLTPHWPLDGFLAKTFTRAVVILLSYGAAWAVLGENIMPCSLLFSFTLLILLSAVGGFIARIIYLPPLVGMILVGFLFTNIPKFGGDQSCDSMNATSGNVTTASCRIDSEMECYALDDDWSSILRRVALVIILTRAGLSLNAAAVKKRGFAIARLAFLPSLAEVCVEAVAAHLLLEMPWDWAFMSG